MAIERWGTLSVKDHLDAQALAADLLLYDWLVFPVMTGPGELDRWKGEHWARNLQKELIKDLGEDVIVKAVWNEARRQRHHDLRRAGKQIKEDAFQPTRMVLAMDRTLPLSADVTEIRAVAAYHDSEMGSEELGITPHQPYEEALGRLAFVIGQRFLIPMIDPPKAQGRYPPGGGFVTEPCPVTSNRVW